MWQLKRMQTVPRQYDCLKTHQTRGFSRWTSRTSDFKSQRPRSFARLFLHATWFTLPTWHRSKTMPKAYFQVKSWIVSVDFFLFSRQRQTRASSITIHCLHFWFPSISVWPFNRLYDPSKNLKITEMRPDPLCDSIKITSHPQNFRSILKGFYKIPIKILRPGPQWRYWWLQPV